MYIFSHGPEDVWRSRRRPDLHQTDEAAQGNDARLRPQPLPGHRQERTDICDNVLLEKLQYTVTRAVEDGTFHRCGVLLIIDEEMLNSTILLKELNMRMRS